MQKTLVLLTVLVGLWITPIAAHSIPVEFLDFLAENPQATDEDIQKFLQDNATLDVEWFGEEETPSLDEELLSFLQENPEATAEELQPEFGQEALNNLWDTFGEEALENKPQGWMRTISNFIKLGFTHILGGWDHVLFVIALALSLCCWKRLMAIITTFTVAHSLTLLLAGTSILTISSSIVEPIIALSIAYVAITNTFLAQKYPKLTQASHQLSIVFFFGLFHGLGFAGVFETLEVSTSQLIVSLLGFNLGVELGQLLILGFTVPLFYMVRRSKKADTFFKIVAIIISLLSIFWFLERVLF